MKGSKVEVQSEVEGESSWLQVVLCPFCPLNGKCMGQEFYGPHALTDDSKTRSVSRTNDGQKNRIDTSGDFRGN